MPSRRVESKREQRRREFAVLAESLRQARLKKEISQMYVARSLGVTTGMLRTWELGLVMPSAANFIGWVAALGMWVEVTDGETGSDGSAVSGVRDAGDLYGDECGEGCGAGRAGSGVGDDGVRA